MVSAADTVTVIMIATATARVIAIGIATAAMASVTASASARASSFATATVVVAAATDILYMSPSLLLLFHYTIITRAKKIVERQDMIINPKMTFNQNCVDPDMKTYPFGHPPSQSNDLAQDSYRRRQK